MSYLLRVINQSIDVSSYILRTNIFGVSICGIFILAFALASGQMTK